MLVSIAPESWFPEAGIFILAELERIAAGDSVPDELLSTIDLIAITMQGLKGEDAND